MASHLGRPSIHAYDQIETLLGQGTLGAELERQVPGAGLTAHRRWRRRPHRRRLRMVWIGREASSESLASNPSSPRR
jgi:hypothetical protein